MLVTHRVNKFLNVNLNVIILNIIYNVINSLAAL